MFVITQGFGGSGSLVVTQGYSSGTVVTAPAEQTWVAPAISRTWQATTLDRTWVAPDPE